MAEAARRPHYSLQDYLLIEEMSGVRHEYLDGDILAMAGGTPDHARICANVISLLSNRLEGRPCAVFTSDVRVRVQASGLDTYPDVSVVCGRAERDAEDKDALTNPVVLVEVTSPSTEAYDRGAKLDHYKRIPSLREVLLVAHGERRVEVWRRREDDRWTADVTATEARLDALGCQLPLDLIYRNPLAGD